MRSLFYLFSLIFLFAQVSLAADCSVMGPGWYWDGYANSCQHVNIPSSTKSSNVSKKSTSSTKTTSSGSSSEAGCRAQLNGSNGCYSYNNRQCSIGFEYCSSEAMCRRNGGAFVNGSCEDPNKAGLDNTCSVNNPSICTITQCMNLQESDDRFNWDDGQRKCVLDSSKQASNSAGTCDPNKSKANPNLGSSLDNNLRAHATAETLKPYEMPCVCNDGKTYVTYAESTSCEPIAKDASTSPEIESCLSSLTKKVQACTTSADKAVTSCSTELTKEQESNNSNIKTGQQVLNAIGQLSVGQKVGSGEVNACVLTTLGTQTAAGLLDTFKEGCASDVSSCTSDCDGIQDLLKNSAAIYAQCGMNIDFNSATSQSMSKREQIDQKIKELLAEFSSADNNCNSKAKGKKTVLEETAGRSVASAQQAAKVCNCQNVAGATNCNNLPTMAQCKLTPGLSGCAVYQNNCVANPNSPACVCVTDPNGNACKLSLNNNPNLQGMVAALNTLPTTNGNVSTGSSYGMKAVKDLIGSLGDEATKVASATTDTGGPASPFATAQGGGGMGGGAGGGGGIQQGEGGPAAEEEKKGIGGGFITSAKNFLSDMFGGKKGGNGVSGVGNGFKVKPNPDAWRPKLRIPGSAGDEYALGSKNKNIFDIMTKRYSDQTHTFIQTP